MYPVMENWKHAGKALRNYKSNFRKLLFDETVATPYQKGSSLQETTINLPWKKRCCSRRDENAVWLTMYPPLPCRWTSLFHLLIAGKRSKRLDNLSRSAESVMLFNPMTGEKGKAQTRKQEGKNPSTPPTAFRRKRDPANFQPCPDRRCRMEIRSRTTCQPQP